MAERTRPPFGRVGGFDDDNDGGNNDDEDEDDCDEEAEGCGDGGGGGWLKRFPGINRLMLSGIPSVSEGLLPAM